MTFCSGQERDLVYIFNYHIFFTALQYKYTVYSHVFVVVINNTRSNNNTLFWIVIPRLWHHSEFTAKWISFIIFLKSSEASCHFWPEQSRAGLGGRGVLKWPRCVLTSTCVWRALDWNVHQMQTILWFCVSKITWHVRPVLRVVPSSRLQLALHLQHSILSWKCVEAYFYCICIMLAVQGRAFYNHRSIGKVF